LDSLLSQTKKPIEVVIVDGGSTDRTIEIVNHYQKRFGKIKLLKEKCTRAKGRNLGVEIAKGEIIAMTDAGCVANDNWLEEITEPFNHKEIDVAAGFYHMTASNSLSKAMQVFLGVTPSKFNINFLPSTRSIAFRKNIWERVGGFPESQNGTAEDTVFNLKLVKNEAKIARVKNAAVEWGMPATLKEFFYKICEYARGDAKSKVWYFPGKGLTSHNIKALSIILRYFVAITLLFMSLKFAYLFPILVILFFLYLIWSFRKVLLELGDYRIAVWGPVLQISSDIAVMYGFIKGIIGK
jgi:cellulose synthase/poly-beta-1,6-N-acetylglucosamine synthase-like glycosyltransferase